MKLLKQKFLSLSLVQQLLILLGSIFLVILLIILPYTRFKLDSIVERQIFESLETQQEQLMDLVENVDHWTEENRFNQGNLLNADFRVKHMLYYSDKSVLEFLTNIPGQEAEYLNKNLFLPIIQKMITSKDTFHQGSAQTQNGFEIYYVVKQSNTIDSVYWISFEYNDLSQNIANGLFESVQNDLLNVLYVTIFIVALTLSVWIYYVIKPLKCITGHIHSIKQGESQALEIERNDEIGEVARALVDMEEELKAQKALQSDLIHNISHDLKTPITIIQSYSESMKDDIYPYGDKDSSLDIIIENAKRLEKKVKEFLLLNRLDYLRNQVMSTQETDMDLLIIRIIKEFEPLHSHIRFELDLDETVFLGEEEHWRSCVLNILENAVRYARTFISITLKEDSLSIYNDGQLLDEQTLNDLFEPYKKGPKGNFGLGLSIVYKIVSMYGYQIQASNKEDGVLFEIKKNT